MLILAFVALAMSSVACVQAEDIDPMMKQAKYKAYAPSPMYADGRSMRTPPANTIPREKKVGNTELTDGVDAAGKTITGFPMHLDSHTLELGKKKFDIHCAICHGLAGDGVSLVGSQMGLRAPPNLHTKAALTNGHIYEVVKNGFGLMAGYGSDLNVDERWAVVAYVRALQRSQNSRIDDVPPAARGELAKEGQ
ncbi:MAG: cytochrome c [Deltaproteobacteria bacterium]|nr:cytochrome c [Deltaproteobacteria bacterium]